MSLEKEPEVRPLWYLASPYSEYPGGRTRAFNLACKKAGELMLEGYAIFSPIAHSHPIEMQSKGLPSTHDFWLGQDITMLHLASGLFVYMMPGWRESFGVDWEVAWWWENRNGRNVRYIPFEEEVA